MLIFWQARRADRGCNFQSRAGAGPDRRIRINYGVKGRQDPGTNLVRSGNRPTSSFMDQPGSRSLSPLVTQINQNQKSLNRQGAKVAKVLML